MAVNEGVNIPWRGWQVVREIGKGGYGTVYEIERTQSGITDRAALKVIRVPKNEYEYNEVAYALSDEEGAKTYFIEQKNKVINEIGAMQKLKATGNIVSIEDWHVYELEDGYSWEMHIRMELLTPLKESFKKHGNLAEEEVVKLGKDICKALILCEKEGIVHRDIKPDNIMVTAHGDYKLGDFGIARNLSNETTLTGVFSPAYVAPEVYNHKKAGKTIDTYSLGLVLYELLNNRRLPFLDAKGVYSGLEREQAIHRRLDGEDLPDPEYGSPELKRIVLKASSYNTYDRYKSANDMYGALEKIGWVKTESKRIGMTIAEPADEEAEIEALKKRLAELSEPTVDDILAKYVPQYVGSYADKAREEWGIAPVPTTTEESEINYALSLEDLEEELFGDSSGEDTESETDKKIDKFYTLYRKNEEFQRLLDEEYNRLRGAQIDLPDEGFVIEPESIVEDHFMFEPVVTPEDDMMFARLAPPYSQNSCSDSPIPSIKDVEVNIDDAEEHQNVYHQWADESGTVGAEKVLKKQENEPTFNTHRPTKQEVDSKVREEIKGDIVITKEDKTSEAKNDGKGCLIIIAIMIIAILIVGFRGEIARKVSIITSHLKGEPEWVREYMGFLDELNSKDEEVVPYDPSTYFLYDINDDAVPEMFLYVTEEEDEEKCLLLTYADKSNIGVSLVGTLVGSVKKIDNNNGLIATESIYGHSDYYKYNIEELMKTGLPDWEAIMLDDSFLKSLPTYCQPGEGIMHNDEYYEMEGIESYDLETYYNGDLSGIRDYYRNHKL